MSEERIKRLELEVAQLRLLGLETAEDFEVRIAEFEAWRDTVIEGTNRLCQEWEWLLKQNLKDQFEDSLLQLIEFARLMVPRDVNENP